MKNLKQRRVRLVDIARECGVSVNTVSHVLRDKPDVSENLKKKIKDTADRMGYIQNSSASFLRIGRSKTISIIIGDISNPHFSIMIKEIEDAARKEGYSAFVINTNENEELEYNAIVTSISKNVDGIIICPVQKSKKNVEFLIKSGVPFTLLGRRFDDIDTNYVVCDDYHSGKLAANYILARCKKIAIIMAEDYISSAKERLIGIEEEYKRRKVKLDSNDIYKAAASGDNREILTNIANRHYDGAISFSDMLALELLSINENIKIVSFDNIASRFAMPIKFSSITSSKAKMSTKSVEIILDAIGKDIKNKHIVLPTKLSEK